MKLDKKERKAMIKNQNYLRTIFGHDAFQRRNRYQCKFEFECDQSVYGFQIIEGKVKHFCKEHFFSELEISCELWEEDNGSFCVLCGELVEYEVVRDQSLPCLCASHTRRYNAGNIYTIKRYQKRMKELENTK